MRPETFQIIRRPIITEKGLREKEAYRTLVFEVAAHATKTQIKEAVEAIFNSEKDQKAAPAGRKGRGSNLVTVVAVRTANFHGKFRRRGRAEGYRRDWKKAYVKLAPDSKMIDYAENV